MTNNIRHWLMLLVLGLNSIQGQCIFSEVKDNRYSSVTSSNFIFQQLVGNINTVYGDCNSYQYVSPLITKSISLLTNIELKNTISYWPNPANDLIFIESKGFIIKDIKIYNKLGQLIKEVQYINSNMLQIDISNLPDGIYIGMIKNNNEESTNIKLLKN